MNKQPMKIRMDKFPYLSKLKQSLKDVQVDIDNLKERQPLLEAEIKREDLSALEKNELQDKLNKLPRKLATLYMDQRKATDQFQKYYDQMEKTVKECNIDFDQIYAQATELAKQGNQQVKQQFDEYSIYDFKENWEAKVNFYGAMKYLINESKKLETTNTDKN